MYFIFEMSVVEKSTFTDRTLRIRRVKMLNIENEIDIEIINGQPVLWESGGSTSADAGKATIICNADGSKKRPIHVVDDINGNHAAFSVKKGDVIIQAGYDGWRQECFVDRIVEIVDGEAVLEGINNLDYCDGWRFPLDATLREAVEAALAKMHDFNCKSVYYALSYN